MRDLADLQERIYAAINNATPQVLHNTWVEVEYRFDFPVPLMEAMLRFMEHKVKKSQFSPVFSNWFHLYISMSSEVSYLFYYTYK